MGFAWQGITDLVRNHAHGRFHLIATIVVVACGMVAQLTTGEWLFILFAIAIVWIAEAMNTAIEYLTNLVSPEENPLAGKAKDVAAGAVLIASIAAAITGLVVFSYHI